MLKVKVGIIGCGNMGQAIINGALSRRIISSRDILVADSNKVKAKSIARRFNVRMRTDNAALAGDVDVLILAVKPQHSVQVLEEIKDHIKPKALVISIMAGVKIQRIAALCCYACPIVRVMPNLAAVAAESLTAICFNRNVDIKQKKIAMDLFSSIGKIYVTREKMMDAVTAVSGSGPAYFFYLAEAMIEAACAMGFSKTDASRLVVQTLKGSSALLDQMKSDPKDIRERVTSKGGTTEAAVKVMDGKGLKDIVKAAVLAASRRSVELSA
jgi:pyrroline-5-carboxylate reductase